MALQYTSTDGILTLPGAYAKWETSASNSGLATSGVIALVGESDIGPSFSDETDGLSAASYGPSQFATVQGKYGSGPLVDAFRVAANSSRDVGVRGAPTQIVCVKTNTGTKASLVLTGAYATARAKSAGQLGNMISVQVSAATAEVAPAWTTQFVYRVAGETIKIAANGGTAVTVASNGITPAAWVAANTAGLAVGNITVTGGVIFQPGNGLIGVTCTVTAVANVITIALAGGNWATTPAANQLMEIANTSSITGAANANSGQYIVTSATSTGLVATKYIDLNGTTLTPPVNVAPGAAVVAGTCDCYTEIVMTNTAAAVSGLGKSLTVYRDPASTGAHYVTALVPITASFYSTSTVENARNILVNRQYDNLSETFRVGGLVALAVGHVGSTTAPVIVSATSISLNGTVVLKSSFSTLADLAAYINAQTNWYATVTTSCRSLPLSVLDYGTFDANQNLVTSTGPARIKKDAYATNQGITASRGIEFAVAPTAGIPAVQVVTFLSGGAKGATTDALVESAFAECKRVKINFVVPLFSRNATLDIADGLTDAASTYTIDGINAYAIAHVEEASKFKTRKARQCFLSKQGTFVAVQAAAQNLANARAWVGFLDVSTIGSAGLQWFQPWMSAVIAAGMQAACFYRPIFNKSVAVYGVRQAAGDFDQGDDDSVEEALIAGLGVIRARDGGGYSFLSDQTSYGSDSNFVYNSIQAVYCADLIAATISQRMERAFIGQSFADLSAAAALAYLKGVFADLLRLKLISRSDDAIEGYKDATVEIDPPAMIINAEVKLSTGVYFVISNLRISEITQVASQG